MTLFLRGFAIFGLLVAGAAQAQMSTQVAANDAAHAARRHPAPQPTEARGDTAMEAMCREILVDTDEGYGVTDHESRVVCDELH